MKRLLIFLVPVLMNLFHPDARAQEPVSADTAEVTIRAIPVTEIIIRATHVNTYLREQRTHLLTEPQKRSLTSRTDTLLFRLALLREDPRIHKTGQLNLRSLENLESEWSVLKSLLDDEQQELNKLLQEKEKQRSEIAQLRSVWELTSETFDKESAAELVVEQIEATLRDIRETQSLFGMDSRYIQEILVEVSSGLIFANQVIEDVLAAKQEVTRNLLSITSPPIWKEFQGKKDTTIVLHEQRSVVEDSLLGLSDFYTQYKSRLWVHLILTLIIIFMVFVIFRNLRHTLPEKDTPEIQSVRNITRRPLASGWMISVILCFILYGSHLPDIIILIVSLLLFPPMIVILRAVILGDARKYMYLPLAAIILVEINRIGYLETLMSRLWLMAIILFSMLILGLIFGRKSQREVITRSRFGRALIIISFVAFALLCIAFFANIAGAITLSEFLAYSVIESAVITLFLYAFVVILHSIITTVVHSTYLKKSSILSQYRDLIYKRLKGLVNLVAVYFLINFILKIFDVWEPVSSGVKSVFTYDIKVGSMAFSLWDLTLFFLILWLTLFISRTVRTFFETEEALRDRMRKGAPGAVSLLLRITIITVGFMLAIAAAGVQMDKLAILLGALGVGIGFGLQNIFNNLVSGIILAFERPIKEGDIIEVGAVLGIVKEIGLRSSVVRTYDGSEVIVPNGNLISNELINWTRTDLRRRGEVLVGVAYGTDPQRVIDLLLETCKSFDQVLNEPEPLALFVGFGDSSLNFRLLFWIADADHRFKIQSHVAVLVNKALAEAGIQIPFPQHDLHIRSVDQKIVDRIRAQDEIARNQEGNPEAE